VRIFRNDINLGYAQNFGRALERCAGDLVFLSDQDDVWFENKIAIMESYALKNPDVLLIMCDALLTDAELNDTGLTKLGQIRSAGFNDESYVMGSCCAVKKELLELCMPVPLGYCAHDDWIVRFAVGLNRRHVMEKSLQWYRRHASNTSGFIANRTKKVTRLDALLYKMRQALLSRNAASIEHVIAQKELLVAGIEKAFAKNGHCWHKELSAMLKREKSEISSLKKRKAVREKKPIARCVSILRAFLAGEYTGVKSAIRDVLG
jgi:glycosyltransferase involved in cell wall biosynthesis